MAKEITIFDYQQNTKLIHPSAERPNPASIILSVYYVYKLFALIYPTVPIIIAILKLNATRGMAIMNVFFFLDIKHNPTPFNIMTCAPFCIFTIDSSLI
jgi:hypothetical protein